MRFQRFQHCKASPKLPVTPRLGGCQGSCVRSHIPCSPHSNENMSGIRGHPDGFGSELDFAGRFLTKPTEMKQVDCQNSPSRLPKARAPTRGRNSEACPSSHLMTDGEWENFWAATDKDCWAAAELSAHVASADMDAEATVVSLLARGCGFKLTVSDTGKPSCTIGKQAYASRGRSSRSTRCGNCTACSAQDCGTCKNCLDKPR